MIVLGQKGLYCGEVVVFVQKCLYSGKVVLFMVLFGQGGSFRAKVVYGQKWFNWGKSRCIQANVVVFVKSGCIRAKWLNSR